MRNNKYEFVPLGNPQKKFKKTKMWYVIQLDDTVRYGLFVETRELYVQASTKHRAGLAVVKYLKEQYPQDWKRPGYCIGSTIKKPPFMSLKLYGS